MTLNEWIERCEKHYQYARNLAPNQIFQALVNLKQVVFEVTDACNLKCKYCGYGEFYNTYEVRENLYMDFDLAKCRKRSISVQKSVSLSTAKELF